MFRVQETWCHAAGAHGMGWTAQRKRGRMSKYLSDKTKKLLAAIEEYGEEFCALNSIESLEELKSRKDDLLKYADQRRAGLERMES